METPHESEGGVSKGEPKGAEGAIPRDTNESFYEILNNSTLTTTIVKSQTGGWEAHACGNPF